MPPVSRKTVRGWHYGHLEHTPPGTQFPRTPSLLRPGSGIRVRDISNPGARKPAYVKLWLDTTAVDCMPAVNMERDR